MREPSVNNTTVEWYILSWVLGAKLKVHRDPAGALGLYNAGV